MEVDTIILSKTIDLNYYGMLCRTINTLKMYNEGIKINFIIVESNDDAMKDDFIVPEAVTIFPREPFNYNRFLNYAMTKSSAEYVFLCNNDLIFQKDSLVNLISIMEKHGLESACPVEPNYHRNHGYLSEDDFTKDYISGYEVQKYVLGWCILTKRTLIDEMGGFDERFISWYQDDDYAMWLRVNQKKHGLVPSSCVRHMFQQSVPLMSDKQSMTWDLGPIFEAKWGLTKYERSLS